MPECQVNAIGIADFRDGSPSLMKKGLSVETPRSAIAANYPCPVTFRNLGSKGMVIPILQLGQS